MKTLSNERGAECSVVEGVGDDAAEVAAEVVGKELFQIHHGGVVFGGEPFAALAHFVAANIAGVSSWHLAACAVVLEYAIGVEALREGYGGYFAVCVHADGKRGTV